ncbi:MAG: hypothetical protein ACHQZS_07415 [Candidatus Binatales bacterium]
MTKTGQLERAASCGAQVWLTLKPVPAVMLLIASATGFLLDKVTVFGALATPACSLANVSEPGLTCRAPLTPEPLRLAALVLLPLESVTAKVPVSAPRPVGAKMTSTTHFAPGVRALPVHPFGSLTVKAPGLVPPMEGVEIVTVAAAFFFGLEIVNFSGLLGAPETPNTSEPKLKLPGAS